MESFAMTRENAEQLLEISVALTAERDREKFLSRVLETAMEAACCDGGTLYLLEDGALKFSRVRTISLGIRQGGYDDPINLPPVPMEPQYVCAWAAMNRKMVNIPDVRNSKTYDFSGSLKYDRMTNYRTKSMLVVPMTGNKGEMIGVMQLINAMEGAAIVPFSANMERMISALGSQAAACILNMQFARQVSALLDSLVDSMTRAIDDRTPYNANHSRNMAGCAERFLDWAESDHPEWRWKADHRRAFMLSIKLHDVGKLVTPRNVMNKSSRLEAKIAGIEERFRCMGLLDRIAALEGRITENRKTEREQSRRYVLDRIRYMDTAAYLSDDDIQWAEELARQTFTDENGTEVPLLTGEETECLRIRHGTLTAAERQVMEAHVTETSHILGQVDFPPEYRAVPVWATAHHEYLDGTGYPGHLTAEQIPAEVLLITILDIFESLVANDRPYKKARKAGEALEIMKDMAAKGKLDAEILRMFEESGAWKAIHDRKDSVPQAKEKTGKARNILLPSK